MSDINRDRQTDGQMARLKTYYPLTEDISAAKGANTNCYCNLQKMTVRRNAVVYRRPDRHGTQAASKHHQLHPMTDSVASLAHSGHSADVET